MIIHDRFVFLRMRKTGCTFLGDALREEFRLATEAREPKHVGWDQIPAEARGRPVLAYVRNPWDWYVSWYEFNASLEEPTDFWSRFSEEGSLDFASTVRNAAQAVTPWGRGFYMAVFNHLIGDGLTSGLLTIGRYESLIDDFASFAMKAGADLPPGGLDRIRARPRINASSRGPYREYYDTELRELVGRSCSWLVDCFGYRF